MSNTYCGKSCAECTLKEELQCPGCKMGPGKRYNGDCSLAKCCMDKGHEDCDTCQIQGHCGTYRGRFYTPEKRLKERQAERAAQERLAKRAPIFGKWLWLLFWLVIPSTVASLMTQESVVAALPALRVPGLILEAVVLMAYVLILLKLSALEPRYQTAAICTFIGSGLVILAGLLTGGKEANWTLLLTLPAAIVSMVGKYNEFTAHSDALSDVDSELSYKWTVLWKWYIGCNLGIFGCLIIVVIAPLLGLLAVVAAAIGIVVVNIVEMVYLYNTAKQFRLYTPLPMDE